VRGACVGKAKTIRPRGPYEHFEATQATDRIIQLKSITQSLSSKQVEFVILPPVGAHVPGVFQTVETNDWLHSAFLTSMQRFRGEIYLEDGAVRPEHLTSDGRHYLPVDEESWHVLTLNEDRKICACLRLHPERAPRPFDELPVAHSPIRHCSTWGGKLRRAVESEIATASAARIHFGDIGGWAIAPERRLTLEPLRTILAGYGLCQQLGGFLGIATATCKHGSAPILRKLGLSPLQADGETIPVYYDPHYSSEMEVLRFDSRRPNPKYRRWIGELMMLLSCAPVICAGQSLAGAVMQQGAPSQMWNPALSGAPFRAMHA
jgi:hypothetical protein